MCIEIIHMLVSIGYGISLHVRVSKTYFFYQASKGKILEEQKNTTLHAKAQYKTIVFIHPLKNFGLPHKLFLKLLKF